MSSPPIYTSALKVQEPGSHDKVIIEIGIAALALNSASSTALQWPLEVEILTNESATPAVQIGFRSTEVVLFPKLFVELIEKFKLQNPKYTRRYRLPDGRVLALTEQEFRGAVKAFSLLLQEDQKRGVCSNLNVVRKYFEHLLMKHAVYL